MSTRTASKAYGEHYAKIVAMVQDMPGQVGNMAADAQRVNWAHVGDLTHIEELCRELAQALEGVTEAHRAVR